MTPPTLKRRGLLGLVASLPIFGRSAQAGPPSFELLPELQAGQHLEFAFERKVQRNGEVMHWYRGPLHVRVLETDGDGALLEWIEGPQTIVDAHPQRRPLLELGLAASRDVALQVRVDRAGRVQSLANAEEVRLAGLSLMDAAAVQIATRPGAGPVVAAMLPALKSAYADGPAWPWRR